MNSPDWVLSVDTGMGFLSGVAKMADEVEIRNELIEIRVSPAGMMARPADWPRTFSEPVMARSPLTVIVPVRDEILDARSLNSRSPTRSLPVTVRSGT